MHRTTLEARGGAGEHRPRRLLTTASASLLEVAGIFILSTLIMICVFTSAEASLSSSSDSPSPMKNQKSKRLPLKPSLLTSGGYSMHPGSDRKNHRQKATNLKRKKRADISSYTGEHSAEYSLYERLLGGTRYQKHVRPVRDHHQPIKVKVGMCVMMVEEIIERDQIMTMAACIKMRWKDDFLQWAPERYDNLTWLAISSTNIWLPDIAIINSPEPYELTRKETNVDVDFHGEVGFFPSGRLATRCNLQITYFPFDWQNCEVRLESWIYPTQYLEIEMYPDDTVDLKEYYTNHQWAVAGYRVLPEIADYDGKNFSSITFTYILRRKSEYYFMYFIFPQLLLALLQTLSHTLPVEHPGRMAMLTSLFIGTSVTQAGIAVHIPKSSDSMSLLQIYMTIMSCNLVFALVVTFVMMYAVLRYPNEEPSFIAMMVAFFSIVWPGDIDKYNTAAPANIQIRRHTFAASPRDRRRSSSSRRKSRDRSRRHQKSHASVAFDDSSDERASRKRRSKEHRVSSKVDKSALPDASNHLTNLRLLFQSRHSSTSPPPGSRPSASRPTRLGIPDNSDEMEAHTQSFSQPDQTDRRDLVLRTRTVKLDEEESNERRKPYKRSFYVNRAPAAHDSSSPEILGVDFAPMNPNVAIDSPIYDDYNEDNFSKREETSMRSRRYPTTRSGRRDAMSYIQRRQNRGEAARMEDTRELKRRWLLYCVALDKTIMYANLVWNIIIPLLLFGIVPVLSPHPFLHVGNSS